MDDNVNVASSGVRDRNRSTDVVDSQKEEGTGLLYDGRFREEI